MEFPHFSDRLWKNGPEKVMETDNSLEKSYLRTTPPFPDKVIELMFPISNNMVLDLLDFRGPKKILRKTTQKDSTTMVDWAKENKKKLIDLANPGILIWTAPSSSDLDWWNWMELEWRDGCTKLELWHWDGFWSRQKWIMEVLTDWPWHLGRRFWLLRSLAEGNQVWISWMQLLYLSSTSCLGPASRFGPQYHANMFTWCTNLIPCWHNHLLPASFKESQRFHATCGCYSFVDGLNCLVDGRVARQTAETGPQNGLIDHHSCGWPGMA